MVLRQQPDTHQPTFRATPKKRTWYRRLTPAAWLLVGVGGVLALLLVVAGLGQLLGSRDSPFVLPPTVTPLPRAAARPATAAPSPAVTPASPPGSWWTAPVVTDTRAIEKMWWVDRMTCNDQGECTPPQELSDEIVAAYWEWKAAIPFFYYELDMTPEELKQHYIGQMLDDQLAFVEFTKDPAAQAAWDGEPVLTEYEYETRHPHVASCAVDGLTCLVGETVRGRLVIYKYDWSQRRIVETIEQPTDRQYHGVNVWRFQYDVEDGKWKVEQYLEWVPAS